MYKKGGMCCPIRDRMYYIKNMKWPTARAAGRFFVWMYEKICMTVMNIEKSFIPLWAIPLINDFIN
jgi:hypothetical protein